MHELRFRLLDYGLKTSISLLIVHSMDINPKIIIIINNGSPNIKSLALPLARRRQ
jgi:hypothetical protein